MAINRHAAKARISSEIAVTGAICDRLIEGLLLFVAPVLVMATSNGKVIVAWTYSSIMDVQIRAKVHGL
jgi:hypothetical protein